MESMEETQFLSLAQDDLLEKEIACRRLWVNLMPEDTFVILFNASCVKSSIQAASLG